MAGEQRELVVYSHARRHPLVLGKIGNWSLPWQLSGAQLVILVAGWAGLYVTRPLWGVLGPLLNGLVLFALPIAGAVAVRQTRIDGRDALRWLVAQVVVASRPRGPQCLGRPVRDRERPRVSRVRAWVREW